MTKTTAQTTLLHTQMRDESREAAIERIKAIMLPGARALAATRHPMSPYTIEHEEDLTGRAPFAGHTLLYWRDSDHSDRNFKARKPFDHERANPTYQVQVILSDSAPPSQIAELARLAAIYTADLIKECDLITAAQCAALDSEATELDAIARG